MQPLERDQMGSGDTTGSRGGGRFHRDHGRSCNHPLFMPLTLCALTTTEGIAPPAGRQVWQQFSLYLNPIFRCDVKKRTSERSAKPHTLLAAWSGPERVVGCRGESQLERRERGSPLAGPHGTHALEDHSSKFESHHRSLFTMYSKAFPETYRQVLTRRLIRTHLTCMPRTVSCMRT